MNTADEQRDPLAMFVVLSIDAAVTPPTCAVAPVPDVATGRTESRSARTRSLVAWLAGRWSA